MPLGVEPLLANLHGFSILFAIVGTLAWFVSTCNFISTCFSIGKSFTEGTYRLDRWGDKEYNKDKYILSHMRSDIKTLAILTIASVGLWCLFAGPLVSKNIEYNDLSNLEQRVVHQDATDFSNDGNTINFTSHGKCYYINYNNASAQDRWSVIQVIDDVPKGEPQYVVYGRGEYRKFPYYTYTGYFEIHLNKGGTL